MTERVHHLNCATMAPRSLGLAPARMVAHCLLVEGERGLTLVDTGFGSGDLAAPRRRLGAPFVTTMRPALDPAETALEQVRALGHAPGDVTDIVLTHLDLDHAGGLPDFPDAEVHTFEAERSAAVDPSLLDRVRYPPCHLEHGPRWAIHAVDGDSWFGFDSVRVLPGVDPEIVLIPLVGHSRGHTGVAVRDGDGWTLHCGDAYFHRNEVATPPSCPPILRGFQFVMAADNGARKRNQERLRGLARDHGEEVRLFCAHDPVELAREQRS